MLDLPLKSDVIKNKLCSMINFYLTIKIFT